MRELRGGLEASGVWSLSARVQIPPLQMGDPGQLLALPRCLGPVH